MRSAWRTRLWWWLPPAVLLALGLASLLVYRTAYAGEVRGLDQTLTNRTEELERLESELQRSRALLAQAEANEAGIKDLLEKRLSTESLRLTTIISEVKRLAERAGLEPTAISYPEEEFSEFGLVERSIVFGVQGSYLQLRRFINLLELSDYFLTLGEVRLSEGGRSERLRISLRISTLFVNEAETQPGGRS